ncbi:hypothetical protein FRC17_010472 [Serendipita sp. 399]|nr:hypothetical protein FRC17_010472 [Serendipita sp. 399]
MPTFDDFIALSPRSKGAVLALIQLKSRPIVFGNGPGAAEVRQRRVRRLALLSSPRRHKEDSDDEGGFQPQHCPPTTELSSDEEQAAGPSRPRPPSRTNGSTAPRLERVDRYGLLKRMHSPVSVHSNSSARRELSVPPSPLTDATITPSRFGKSVAESSTRERPLDTSTDRPSTSTKAALPEARLSKPHAKKSRRYPRRGRLVKAGAETSEADISELGGVDSDLSDAPLLDGKQKMNLDDRYRFMQHKGIWFERVHSKLVYPPTEDEIEKFLKKPNNSPRGIFPYCKSVGKTHRLGHADHQYLCRVNVEYQDRSGWRSTPMCNAVLFGVESYHEHMVASHLHLDESTTLSA